MIRIIHAGKHHFSFMKNDDKTLFSIGYTTLGKVLYASNPVIGQRMTVKYTPTDSDDDWEIYVTAKVTKIIEK